MNESSAEECIKRSDSVALGIIDGLAEKQSPCYKVGDHRYTV